MSSDKKTPSKNLQPLESQKRQKETVVTDWPPHQIKELGLETFPSPHQQSRMALASAGIQGFKVLIGSSAEPKFAPDEIEPDDFSDNEKEQFALVANLLADRDYEPPENIRGSYWWILPEILAGMPFKFRKLAMAKFEEGIRVFGKIPVRQDFRPSAVSTGTSKTISIVGPARPMGCPEPPPEGGEFILAWREGEFWNWNLEEFEVDWNLFTAGRLQPRMLMECEKYHHCLRNQAAHGDSLAASTARGILEILGQRPQVRQATGPSDLEVGLYAGVLLSRLVLYRAADELYAEKLTPKKSAWRDIIRYALQRHGWELSADELLKAIGGSVSDAPTESKKSKGARHLKFPGWCHVPHDEKLTFKDFSKRITDLRGNHKKTDPSRAYLSQVKRLLKQVPGRQNR